MESMIDTLRLYFDATLAVAVMFTLSVVAAFIAAAVTEDRTIVALTAGAVFSLTGAVLVVRLWLMIRRPALPVDSD
jgi:hypothetical protein